MYLQYCASEAEEGAHDRLSMHRNLHVMMKRSYTVNVALRMITVLVPSLP